MLRIAAALAASSSLCIANACEMFEYRHVKASPHVHVFQAAEGTTAVVNGNIVAVVGERAVLLVDTGQIPSVARRVLADLRRLSLLPITHIVNTHWHGDHVLANFVFKEAFPAAKIVAHPHTVERAASFYTDYAAKNRERLPAIIADMGKRRDASTDPEEKEWLAKTVDCAEKMLPEMEVTKYVAPDVTLEGDMRIDLGGVTALVRHLGEGNTPGDIVVLVEGDRLVAAGDMIVAPTPYAIGSSLEPWRRTLAELRKLGAATFVPGHGPVMRDDVYLRDLDALFATTYAQLKEMQQKGVSRKDAESRLDIGAFKARLDTPMKRQAFLQFYVRAAIAQVWPKPPG
ncbi:MAG TPA: MBL fold metallo-hydrolase [Usitatibacter sp.]|nr:MBL fold metallo-hydrolase [Usitatibacter sp.]